MFQTAAWYASPSRTKVRTKRPSGVQLLRSQYGSLGIASECSRLPVVLSQVLIEAPMVTTRSPAADRQAAFAWACRLSAEEKRRPVSTSHVSNLPDQCPAARRLPSGLTARHIPAPGMSRTF